ncbi:MAG TPA: glycosyltransferase [Candidatus Saccharimonadales bacterium]|nr:glycosyltransferase [Candidatus Saccharimonadales bacterium]
MFRIKKRVGKYEYVIEQNQVWLVRLLGAANAFGVLSLAWGYARFVQAEPILLLMSPLFLLVVVYFAVNALLLALYPGFSSKAHARLVKQYWQASAAAPSVTVFIPAAGEPLWTVARTAFAAAALHYDNKQVYILDDTPEGKYRQIAIQSCVGYIHRPETGRGKKSGNLNYALAHTPDSDHVLVLDADFVCRREMLREMVPYTASDIGIVQTPQHFETSKHVFAQSKIAFGAGYVQRDFYRFIQVARNRFSSAICVGTNALYNRRALSCIGGFAEVDHSEDVNTGLRMMNHVREDGRPFRVRYVPVQLATGECPDTYYGYYKQQNRWSTGSFRLVFSRFTVFSKVLRPAQKLIYFSNCLYYLYTIGILCMPLQFLLLVLIRHPDYHWGYTYFFVPQILLRLVVMPYVFRQRRKRLATILVTMCTAFTFAQALYLLVIRRPLGWEATGATHKPRHNRFKQLKVFATVYFVLVVIGTAALAILNEALGEHTAYLLQALFLFSLASQAIHLVYLHLYSEGERPGRIPRQALTTLGVVGVIGAGAIMGAAGVHRQYNFYVTGPSIGLSRQGLSTFSRVTR